MVELTNRQSHDRVAMWPLAKLQERIFEMREFYQSSMTNKKMVDPFSDRPPWFRSIGRAFMSIESLLYEVPVEHELLVLNEACAVVGRIRVSIMPGQLITNLNEKEMPPGMYEEMNVDFSEYDGESSDDRVEFHHDGIEAEHDAASERLMERAGSECVSSIYFPFSCPVLSSFFVLFDFLLTPMRGASTADDSALRGRFCGPYCVGIALSLPCWTRRELRQISSTSFVR